MPLDFLPRTPISCLLFRDGDNICRGYGRIVGAQLLFSLLRDGDNDEVYDALGGIGVVRRGEVAVLSQICTISP